ncbi:MAG: vWA domain-containing protein [Myxococcota bacterium]
MGTQRFRWSRLVVFAITAASCAGPGDGSSGVLVAVDAPPGLDGLAPDHGGDVAGGADLGLDFVDAVEGAPDVAGEVDAASDGVTDREISGGDADAGVANDGDGQVAPDADVAAEVLGDADAGVEIDADAGADADADADAAAEIDACQPTSCAAQDLECGAADDGCGATLACGACDPALECVAGHCIDPCGPPACAPLWSSTCSGATGYKVCGLAPATGCPQPSLFVSCQFGNSCADGACSGACVVPEVMLVVDRSSSMAGPVWKFTRATLLEVTDAWQAQVKLGLRPFPGELGCDAGTTFGMALDNAGVFATGLVDPAVSSSTPLAAALSGLASYFGDPTQGEVVILLSDGSETCDAVSAAADVARTLRSRGTIVHTVGVGFGYDAELLAAVALAGGGTFSTAQTGPALKSALQAVLADEVGCAQPEHGVSYCLDGVCELHCADGFHVCGDACVDDSAVTSCGAKCEPCAAPAHGIPLCDAGACDYYCVAGYHPCGGGCADDTSPATCGQSCTACPAPPNAKATCEGGACGFACVPGFHECGGVCVDDTSPATCGSSCDPCPTPAHGAPTCAKGACDIDCDSGFLACAGVCAACAADPHGAPACDGAACVTVCEAGYHLCGGVCAADADVATCGTGCAPCPLVPGGAATCDGTACGYVCDGDHLDCGGACALCPDDPHGSPICDGAACTSLCDDGYLRRRLRDRRLRRPLRLELRRLPGAVPDATATCNGVACGTCRRGYQVRRRRKLCPDDPKGHGVGSCVGGACGLDCDPGFHACGGDSCEPDDSVAACGPSCKTCTAPASALAYCNGSGCDYDCLSGGKMPCLNGLACCDWVTTTLETTANGAQPHGLHIDGNGKIHALWRDADPGTIRYGVKTQTWSYEDLPTGGVAGISAALAIHPQGFPAIAYADADEGTSFAVRGGGGWGAEKVGSEFPIAVAATYDGLVPHVVYGRFSLRHAWKAGTTWSEQVIDDFETPVHELKYVDMAIDSLGVIHVVYRNDEANLPWEVDAPVIYANNAGGAWMMETVAPVSARHGVALAVSDDGVVHVVYDDTKGLGYARRDEAGWTYTHLRNDARIGSIDALTLSSSGAPWVIYAVGTTSVRGELSRLVGDTWIHEIVDFQSNTGGSAAIDLDTLDRPHVLHHRVEYTGSNALYVQRTRYMTLP